MHFSLDKSKIPQHVAIIMDGNGRWAKKQGAARLFGHQNAIEAVRNAVEGCAELGIKVLTLYAFSTENWMRPQEEVNGLMQLLVNTIDAETSTLLKNNIKLAAIGDLLSLPKNCQQQLQEAIQKTSSNTGMTLVLALSYSGKWDITNAMRLIAYQVQKGTLSPEDINESIICQYLQTHNLPDPELMIRTSGEQRISNFMLWQLAYSELYFTDVLWPDFRKEHLYLAIADYQSRERRFGKISEQLS
ncbi:MAG: isoprenyl transferase [Cytophagales bacterium]|nr:isoprenyl transferase [Cytophagales bacterium]MDW8383147.1 isoprenyl transferase [Flammeovirgaceae bacterium]